MIQSSSTSTLLHGSPSTSSRVSSRPRGVRRVSWDNVPKTSNQMKSTAAISTHPAGQKGSTSTVPVRTPLLLTWAFTTLVWSIFTPPDRTYAARMLLFQPLWLVRMFTHDATWSRDLILFQVIHAFYSYQTGAWRFFQRTDFAWLDLTDHTMQMYLQVFSLLGLCAILAGGINFRGLVFAHQEANEVAAPLIEQRIEEQVLPPLLLPSRTTHSRIFPKKHSFSYSYLFVGIPVGFQGRMGRALSVDSKKRGWFVVDSADYLLRSESASSSLLLSAKLQQFLQTKQVPEEDYAFAYLVTAPRFLGYSFNPVSFWYLYDSDTILKYMVLEVNNTFDERRIYLLRPAAKPDVGDDSDQSIMTFTQQWEKDFHVSPFNSRKGSYSLKAIDPLMAYEKTGRVKIDNTIVLRSSKEHVKIVARVFTEGSPQDPKTISAAQLTGFIMGWWWVGFATFPRIVYEAGRLFFRRSLHVWYRPEVTGTSIGRPYSDDERTLETFFRAFVTQVVQDSRHSLRVIYEPAHSNEPEIVLYSPRFSYEEDHEHTLTLKVLSPAFYSRLIHYASIREAFDRECLTTDEKNQTLNIQNANAIPIFLKAIDQLLSSSSSSSSPSPDSSSSNPSSPDSSSKESLPLLGRISRIRWNLMSRLRCPPAIGSYAASDPKYIVRDIRASQKSDLDTFVRDFCEDREAYRHITTKFFLAERIGLGIAVLVDVMDAGFVAMLLLLSMVYSDFAPKYLDILRPGVQPWTNGDVVVFVLVALPLANAVHLWSLAKGMT